MARFGKLMKKQCQHLPWLKPYLENLLTKFPNGHDQELLQQFLGHITDEIKTFNTPGKKKRKEALFETIKNLYLHLWWGIHWRSVKSWRKFSKKGSCTTYASNVRTGCFAELLGHLIHLGIILSEGVPDSHWINQVLQAINLLPSSDDIMYNSLLMISKLKKSFHCCYVAILKHVLCTEVAKYIAEPTLYVKNIILFRRLKMFTEDKVAKTAVVSIAAKIKPPPDIMLWLSDQNLGVTFKEEKNIAQQLLCKKSSKIIFQKLYRIVFGLECLEESNLDCPETLMNGIMEPTTDGIPNSNKSSLPKKVSKKRKEHSVKNEGLKLKKRCNNRRLASIDSTKNIDPDYLDSSLRVTNSRNSEKKSKKGACGMPTENEKSYISDIVPSVETSYSGSTCLPQENIDHQNDQTITVDSLSKETGIDNLHNTTISDFPFQSEPCKYVSSLEEPTETTMTNILNSKQCSPAKSKISEKSERNSKEKKPKTKKLYKHPPLPYEGPVNITNNLLSSTSKMNDSTEKNGISEEDGHQHSSAIQNILTVETTSIFPNTSDLCSSVDSQLLAHDEKETDDKMTEAHNEKETDDKMTEAHNVLDFEKNPSSVPISSINSDLNKSNSTLEDLNKLPVKTSHLLNLKLYSPAKHKKSKKSKKHSKDKKSKSKNLNKHLSLLSEEKDDEDLRLISNDRSDTTTDSSIEKIDTHITTKENPPTSEQVNNTSESTLQDGNVSSERHSVLISIQPNLLENNLTPPENGRTCVNDNLSFVITGHSESTCIPQENTDGQMCEQIENEQTNVMQHLPENGGKDDLHNPTIPHISSNLELNTSKSSVKDSTKMPTNVTDTLNSKQSSPTKSKIPKKRGKSKESREDSKEKRAKSKKDSKEPNKQCGNGISEKGDLQNNFQLPDHKTPSEDPDSIFPDATVTQISTRHEKEEMDNATEVHNVLNFEEQNSSSSVLPSINSDWNNSSFARQDLDKSPLIMNDVPASKLCSPMTNTKSKKRKRHSKDKKLKKKRRERHLSIRVENITNSLLLAIEENKLNAANTNLEENGHENDLELQNVPSEDTASIFPSVSNFHSSFDGQFSGEHSKETSDKGNENQNALDPEKNCLPSSIPANSELNTSRDPPEDSDSSSVIAFSILNSKLCSPQKSEISKRSEPLKKKRSKSKKDHRHHSLQSKRVGTVSNNCLLSSISEVNNLLGANDISQDGRQNDLVLENNGTVMTDEDIISFLLNNPDLYSSVDPEANPKKYGTEKDDKITQNNGLSVLEKHRRSKTKKSNKSTLPKKPKLKKSKEKDRKKRRKTSSKNINKVVDPIKLISPKGQNPKKSEKLSKNRNSKTKEKLNKSDLIPYENTQKQINNISALGTKSSCKSNSSLQKNELGLCMFESNRTQSIMNSLLDEADSNNLSDTMDLNLSTKITSSLFHLENKERRAHGVNTDHISASQQISSQSKKTKKRKISKQSCTSSRRRKSGLNFSLNPSQPLFSSSDEYETILHKSITSDLQSSKNNEIVTETDSELEKINRTSSKKNSKFLKSNSRIIKRTKQNSKRINKVKEIKHSQTIQDIVSSLPKETLGMGKKSAKTVDLRHSRNNGGNSEISSSDITQSLLKLFQPSVKLIDFRKKSPYNFSQLIGQSNILDGILNSDTNVKSNKQNDETEDAVSSQHSAVLPNEHLDTFIPSNELVDNRKQTPIKFIQLTRQSNTFERTLTPGSNNESRILYHGVENAEIASCSQWGESNLNSDRVYFENPGATLMRLPQLSETDLYQQQRACLAENGASVDDYNVASTSAWNPNETCMSPSILSNTSHADVITRNNDDFSSLVEKCSGNSNSASNITSEGTTNYRENSVRCENASSHRTSSMMEVMHTGECSFRLEPNSKHYRVNHMGNNTFSADTGASAWTENISNRLVNCSVVDNNTSDTVDKNLSGEIDRPSVSFTINLSFPNEHDIRPTVELDSPLPSIPLNISENIFMNQINAQQRMSRAVVNSIQETPFSNTSLPTFRSNISFGELPILPSIINSIGTPPTNDYRTSAIIPARENLTPSQQTIDTQILPMSRIHAEIPPDNDHSMQNLSSSNNNARIASKTLAQRTPAKTTAQSTSKTSTQKNPNKALHQRTPAKASSQRTLHKTASCMKTHFSSTPKDFSKPNGSVSDPEFYSPHTSDCNNSEDSCSLQKFPIQKVSEELRDSKTKCDEKTLLAQEKSHVPVRNLFEIGTSLVGMPSTSANCNEASSSTKVDFYRNSVENSPYSESDNISVSTMSLSLDSEVESESSSDVHLPTNKSPEVAKEEEKVKKNLFLAEHQADNIEDNYNPIPKSKGSNDSANMSMSTHTKDTTISSSCSTPATVRQNSVKKMLESHVENQRYYLRSKKGLMSTSNSYKCC